MQFSMKKTNNPVKKWAEYLNRHFPKDEIQMAKTHIYCSALLSIREMQISVRYHLIPVRMVIIKKFTNNEHWRWCGEKGTHFHCR